MTLSEPLTQISRSRYFLTLNNMKMIQDIEDRVTAILTTAIKSYSLRSIERCHFQWPWGLNDLYPRFQGHAIIWCWISQKLYEIHSFNVILTGTIPKGVISNDRSVLATYSMTWSVARSLRDSWASCCASRQQCWRAILCLSVTLRYCL